VCKQNREDMMSEAETFEKRIPHLRGQKREEAMRAYRRILLSRGEKPIYLVRS
jgi:hypothetical protein